MPLAREFVISSGLFDSSFYLAQNPDVARAGVDPLCHYLTNGAAEGRDPHPLFDTSFYVMQYPDVAASGANPLVHYLRRGWQAGCNPHPLFDTTFYRNQNPDVARAGVDPLCHYLTNGAAEGRDPHPLFDTSFYVMQYPDVAASGANPLVHYLRRGWQAGCNPHPLFDTTFYRNQNPDVARAGVDPLCHYLTNGAAEGRDPHPLFDTSFYVMQYPDVAASGANPLVHYLRRGWQAGCNPHPLFDTTFYWNQNPGVAQAGVDPLCHYLTNGAAEGRDPHPLFDTSFYVMQYPDVAASGANPLVHYVAYGACEWRMPNRRPDERWPLRNALTGVETAAASHVEAKEFGIAIRLIQAQVAEISSRTQLRGWISGSDRLDGLCLSIGREVRGVANRRRPVSRVDRRRCVYVVSELYRDGGHTRILEDLITAQPHADHQIIWTWCESADAIANMAEVLRVKEAVPLQRLRGEPMERLCAAFAFLTEFCPDTLVHLGHPNDPLAIALMQPGIAQRQLIIHHSDWGFALGRSLGEAVHVALGQHFQDFARSEWALETVLLPLTCEEPVLAKPVILAGDRPFLTTVTSGSSGKFDLSGKLSYLDILKERFDARDGVHVHIGSLSVEQMLRIQQLLDELSCSERFVHKEHVPHLASALRQLTPAVYIDSYPIGGARAIVEAMAAGLPICASSHDPNLDSSSFCYPGHLSWTHPAEMGTILANLNRAMITHQGALSRNHFERNHSPRTFEQRVRALVN